MSVIPVIVRELRAQARQPWTYWLRIAGGVSVVAAMAIAVWSIGNIRAPMAFGWTTVRPNPVQEFGSTLFGKMNLFMFLAIWLFVPLTTADAISRERREGTLVLLYLTELRSIGIVVGKAFVHLLRSASLFLTMAPWLMLPVIFGGVGLNDIRIALGLNGAALLLAHSAGMLASTIPKDALKSMLLAALFALCLLVGLLYAHGLVLSHAMATSTPKGLVPGGVWRYSSGFWSSMLQGGLLSRTLLLLSFATNGSFDLPYYRFVGNGSFQLDSNWEELWSILAPAGHKAWFVGVATLVLSAALVAVLSTLLAAWRVKRSWQDAPAPLLDSEQRRKYLTPRFGVSLLRSNLSRALASNPIGWLQNYSPSARLVKWGWCLALIVVEVGLSASATDLYDAQAGLGLALLLGMTFTAIGSFRNELETGAFELLLVTPLRERQIILGRARGIWRQFLPAILVYGAGSIYLASGWHNTTFAEDAWSAIARTAVAFCAMPLIGLYFSMRRWNFFAAWLAASLIGIVAPGVGRAFGASDASMMALQLTLALTASFLLQQRLRTRAFVQHKGER